MQLANVAAKQKKKFKATTDSKHKLPVAPNVLDRNYIVSQPDIVYCSDITYIWTAEGWLYLAVIIDLYSRKIVGWSLKSRMTKDLVINCIANGDLASQAITRPCFSFRSRQSVLQ